MELIGYCCAIIIGAFLGLMGGGGSILTVPVLVYLLGINPVLATAYSLFVVGTTSLVGAIKNIQKKNVNFNAALLFAIPSLMAVFTTRRFIMPSVPDVIVQVDSLVISKDVFIMIVFAILMILASVSMIKQRKVIEPENSAGRGLNYPMVIIEGIAVGFVTGFVGAGGGFLIIPVLVIFRKLPMKVAIGTSLTIIAINSLIGFTGDLYNSEYIDWSLLLIFTSLSVIGVFIGTRLSHNIPGNKLKPAFGWFVLVMGIYIIVREISSAKF